MVNIETTFLIFIVGGALGTVLGYGLCRQAQTDLAHKIFTHYNCQAVDPEDQPYIIEETPDDAEEDEESRRLRKLQDDPDAWKNF